MALLATATLASRVSGIRGGVGWINFGIAGCSERRYGEACLSAKVTDGGNERSWYPVPTWRKKADLPRLPLTTVEKSFTDYSKVNGLVEMEASGFYGIALKQSSVELVQVLKIVSDDPDHSIEALNPAIATELCERAWPTVEPWLDAFREVIGEDADRIADPSGFVEWCDRCRLSVTQVHQLRRLLQEWDSLSDDPIELPPEDLHGNAALQLLRDQLLEMRERQIQV